MPNPNNSIPEITPTIGPQAYFSLLFLNLSDAAPLFDGFFPDSNLRVEPPSRLAESKINPNHINEGHQESQSETVAVQPPVPLAVFPGDAQVTEKGNL